MVMIVKSKKSSRLTPEGPHIATLASVKGKPNDEAPKKAILRFAIDGREDQVTKEVPVSFEEKAPLRRDAETLLGRQLTAKEAEEGLDLSSLVGRPCRVVVAHKPGVGGRPIAVVTLIQCAPEVVSA